MFGTVATIFANQSPKKYGIKTGTTKALKLTKRTSEKIIENGKVKTKGRGKNQKKTQFSKTVLRKVLGKPDSANNISFYGNKFAPTLHILLCKVQEISVGACNFTQNDFFGR